MTSPEPVDCGEILPATSCVILCACAGRDTRSAFCESEGALEGRWSGSQPWQGAALGALGWCSLRVLRVGGSVLRAKETHGFSSVPSRKRSWKSFRCRVLNQLKSEVIVHPPCFSMFASSLDWKNDIVGADFSTRSRFQQWRWEGQNPRMMAFLCWRGSGHCCCCCWILDHVRFLDCDCEQLVGENIPLLPVIFIYFHDFSWASSPPNHVLPHFFWSGNETPYALRTISGGFRSEGFVEHGIGSGNASARRWRFDTSGGSEGLCFGAEKYAWGVPTSPNTIV